MSISSRGKLSGAIKGDSELKGFMGMGDSELKGFMGMGNPTKGAVKFINGIGPDKNGNIELEIPECKVQSVNGIEPDENGNVEIHIPESKLQSVNGVEPDENGNVEIDTMPDGLEQITILSEADMLPAIHDDSGAILTDENGNVILRY